MPLRDPKFPCPVCGFSPLERGGINAASDETECPRCLAQHSLEDDGALSFTYNLPGLPLPPSAWDRTDLASPT